MLKKTLRDFRETKPQLYAEVQTALGYRLRMPKTHFAWEDIVTIAMLSLLESEAGNDREIQINSYFWRDWVIEKHPTYCISNEILRHFQATDASGICSFMTEDWAPPFDQFLINLPRDAVAPPGSKEHLICLMVNYTNYGRANVDFRRQINIIAFDTGGVAWCSSHGIVDGKLVVNNRHIGRDRMVAAEDEWLMMLTKLAMQATLAIQYIPDLITPENSEEPERKGFGKPHKPRPRQMDELAERNPRWIGRDFVRTKGTPVARTATAGGGSHASPVSHWRRGHWRLQGTGEHRATVRPIWIKPTLVNIPELSGNKIIN